MESKKSFAGIPAEFANRESSKIALIPVAYDGTSTWKKGADKGPEAFLEAAENMELYDIETDTEVYTQGIYLHPKLEGFNTPDTMVIQVYNTVLETIKRNKFVTLFGGEHSISIGAIDAFNACYNDLTVLQIDAHADLRPTYQGSKYNHACAMYKASQETNLVQVGIRSMDAIEMELMETDKVFFAHDMAQDDSWMDNAIEAMTDNVYITLDLDALDPSILPATGTPEPGGLLWYETLEFLAQVFEQKNVVGFDIVELCPNKYSSASNFLAAKLYYKMLSYKFLDVDDHEPYFMEGAKGKFEKKLQKQNKFELEDDYDQ